MLSPRPTDWLDRLLMPGGDQLPVGVLACYHPVLPPQASCDAATWIALRVRRDERWREHQGPIGDALRALAADGVIRLDDNGVLLDPDSDQPLTDLSDVVSVEGEDR